MESTPLGTEVQFFVAEDSEVAFHAWLAVPASSQLVLENAERRLIGSLKHGDPRAKQIRNAERVRQAHLGCLKARLRVASLPTDIEDEECLRYEANLRDARSEWQAASVDEILDVYSRRILTA